MWGNYLLNGVRFYWLQDYFGLLLKMTKLTKIKVVIISSILFVTYLFFSPPDGVVADHNGKLAGVFNDARALLQGERFWEQQLIEVNNMLSWEIEEPSRRASSEREDEEFWKEIAANNEQLYLEYPDMRPSLVEQQVQQLRDIADNIENEELLREFEQFRLQTIDELQRIKALVELKLE